LPGARLHSWGLVVSTEAEREAAYFKLCDDVRLDLEIRREIAYQKNKKHNRLPRQILSSQLSKLADMEASIKSLNQ